MLMRAAAITIRDAGLQGTNHAAVADALMPLGTHNRPDMLPMVLAIVTGAFVGPTDLWNSDDDTIFVVLRLAYIDEFVKPTLLIAAADRHPSFKLDPAVAAALVDRHAPKLNHNMMNSLEVVLAFHGDQHSNNNRNLLDAMQVLQTVVSCPRLRCRAGMQLRWTAGRVRSAGVGGQV
ncbi:hypothetical protein BC828DRAFT_18591 [Blastocladiella britannica]|nr:hypothetical protein BC828DRAFT_18591 [Blastocladiella britannica]